MVIFMVTTDTLAKAVTGEPQEKQPGVAIDTSALPDHRQTGTNWGPTSMNHSMKSQRKGVLWVTKGMLVTGWSGMLMSHSLPVSQALPSLS